MSYQFKTINVNKLMKRISGYPDLYDGIRDNWFLYLTKETESSYIGFNKDDQRKIIKSVCSSRSSDILTPAGEQLCSLPFVCHYAAATVAGICQFEFARGDERIMPADDFFSYFVCGILEPKLKDLYVFNELFYDEYTRIATK